MKTNPSDAAGCLPPAWSTGPEPGLRIARPRKGYAVRLGSALALAVAVLAGSARAAEVVPGPAAGPVWSRKPPGRVIGPPPVAATPFPLPAWAGRAPWTEDGAYHQEIQSEVWNSPDAAWQDALTRAQLRAQHLLRDAAPGRGIDRQLTLDFTRTYLVRDAYTRLVETPAGPRYRSHLLLTWSAADRDRLVRDWRDQQVYGRTLLVGAGFIFAVICLMVTAGYLRLDDATRGYYTGRLRLAAGLILASSALALFGSAAYLGKTAVPAERGGVAAPPAHWMTVHSETPGGGVPW